MKKEIQKKWIGADHRGEGNRKKERGDAGKKGSDSDPAFKGSEEGK